MGKATLQNDLDMAQWLWSFFSLPKLRMMEEHHRNEALSKVLDSEGTNVASVDTSVDPAANPAAALEGAFVDGAGLLALLTARPPIRAVQPWECLLTSYLHARAQLIPPCFGSASAWLLYPNLVTPAASW